MLRSISRAVHTAAFPPIFRIRWPASAANGCVHATMPLVLWTTLLLLGCSIKVVSTSGKIAFCVKPILGNVKLLKGMQVKARPQRVSKANSEGYLEKQRSNRKRVRYGDMLNLCTRQFSTSAIQSASQPVSQST